MADLLLRVVNKARRLVQGDLRPEMESVYQGLLRRDLARLGIADEFYPVGWAANHGLLYLICRICTTLPVTKVLELGAGQSSILLDRLAGQHLAVTTIEHDAAWAARVQRHVNYPITQRSLIEVNDGSYHYQSYDLPDMPLIDLLIIDGPPGGRNSYARHGALRLADRVNPDGGIVIIDDAERPAEARLAERFYNRFKQANVAPELCFISAGKRQAVIAFGSLKEAAYF